MLLFSGLEVYWVRMLKRNTCVAITIEKSSITDRYVVCGCRLFETVYNIDSPPDAAVTQGSVAAA